MLVSRSYPLLRHFSTRPFFAQTQSRLPRLPVPELDDTLARFMARVKPLVDLDEYKETERLVDDLRMNHTPLQDALVQFAKTQEGTYFGNWWENEYLGPRYPVMINVNPFFLLERDNGARDQISRAGRLARAIAAVQNAVHKGEDGDFTPDLENKTPLCMSQYAKFLSSARVPGKYIDHFVVSPPSEHFAVLCNGHLYRLNVCRGGKLVTESEVLATLQKIKQDAESRPPPEVSIPTFTGADRTSWWQARSSLECLPANRETFEMVDSAIGVLSLASDLCNDWDSLARALLHGNGRSIWFDKPLSIIVTADGEAGVNFEHTPADGHTVLRFVREAAQFLRGSGVDPGPDANAGQPQVLRSDFRMPDDKAADLRSLHRRCLGAIRDNMSTLRLTSLLFKEFGREDIKKAGFAPDGFTQMAFQLSYHRLYGTWVSCYESCMTKQFLHGRTEAIRSTSTEAQDFVAAMLSGSSTKGSKRAALERAIKAHSQQAALCRNGLGVDRHLYGLGKIATESGLPIPALLQSPAYKALSSSVLSTSNVSDTSLSLFGFGPVAPNGFGIGYVQHADSMRFCVSSFGRWTEGLVEDLNLALREMIML
eukprot:Rmarinus@m.24928